GSDWVRRVPADAEAARPHREAAAAIRPWIGRRAAGRPDLDRVLSPKPPEHQHRQAHRADAERRVPDRVKKPGETSGVHLIDRQRARGRSRPEGLAYNFDGGLPAARPALDAVQRWKFTPARLNDEATPVAMTVTVQVKRQRSGRSGLVDR